MKYLKKFLAYFSIVFLLIVLTLVLIAELAENKVASIALKRINEQVDANITVSNIDFSLMRDFPDAMVEFQDVCVSIPDDTLAKVSRIFISVEVKPLLKSEFIIKEIVVEGGISNYHIDSVGKTNFDVFLDKPAADEPADTSSASLYLSLKHLELNNLFCSFADEVNNVKACLYIDNGLTSVYFDSENTKATFKGQLRANNCEYPESPLHLMEETSLNMDVVYFNDVVTINDLLLQSDGIMVQANGEIRNDSSVYTDINLLDARFELAEVKKYIPDSLVIDYGIKDLSGLLSCQAKVKGLYNDSVMPLINANLQLKQGRVELAPYLPIEDLKLNVNYTNGQLRNDQTTAVIVDTFAFKAGGSKGYIAGSINDLTRINYKLKGDVQLNLQDVSAYVPDSLASGLEGVIALNMNTQGVLPQKYDMAFAQYLLDNTNATMTLSNVGFEMDSLIDLTQCNAVLTYKNKGFQLSQVSAVANNYGLSITNGLITGSYAGNLSDINSLEIKLDELDVATPKSHIKGSAYIKNIGAPEYKFEADVTADLNEFNGFAPDSMVKNMSGIVKAQLVTEGSINMDSISDDVMESLFTTSVINAEMANVNVAMYDSLLNVTQLNGAINLQDDSISISRLNGELAGISFDSDSTYINNFYNAYWLNQPQTIKAEGYFNIGDVDFAMFAPFMEEDSLNETVEADTSEPAKYKFAAKGKIRVKSFWYDNALIENISALYNVSDSLYIADQIKFDAFKGSTNSSVRVEMLPDDVMKINFKNSTQGLDVNQLLYDFDDFMEYTDEVYISHEQLSGTLSTDSLSGQILYIGDSLAMDKIKLRAKLKLEEGRLREYPITKEMGQDYNIDGLDDLQFKTLNATVFVSGGSIYAPLTNIKTNTFDISLFGKQEFNLDCQYHIRFYLKEILRKGKTDRLERKQAKEDKQDDYGGTKGLTSLFAVYKVENGKTTKSTLEGKDSQMRKKMKSLIYVKEAFAELEFHPLIVKYNTGIVDE